MRILHTSDWHLGKRLEGRDRTQEQRGILAEIAEIAAREEVDLALVAGDVFDTYTPSADAEDAFFEGALRLSSVCPTVVIGGNHDDAKRLAASRLLAEKREIYIAGNNRTTFRPPERPAFGCRLSGSGEGWLVFEKGSERVYVGVLPYPNETRFQEAERGDVSDADKIRGWMADCFRANVDGLPQILLSHLFAENAVSGGGEREISLGGARAVPKDYFPDCAYIALGHIHKHQKLSESKNIWYSGAIAQYAFDEANAEKYVQVFDLEGGKAENIRRIPLTKGRALARLAANSLAAAETLLEKYSDRYVELTLSLEHPLAPSEYKGFMSGHPNVVSLQLDFSGAREQTAEISRRNLSDRELFESFYRSRTGSEAPEDLLALFLRLMEGEDEAD